MAVGVMYANPEGVRTDETEDQFEEVQEEVGIGCRKKDMRLL